MKVSVYAIEIGKTVRSKTVQLSVVEHLLTLVG